MSRHKRRLPIEGLSDGEELLLSMVIAVTAQLSATRERLDTVEALLARHGIFADDAVESFAASEADAARRDKLRQSLVAKVMEPIENNLQAARDRLENDDA